MYHCEGMTTAAIGQDGYRRTIAANSAKFRQRWHAVLAERGADLSADDLHWATRDELGLAPRLDVWWEGGDPDAHSPPPGDVAVGPP
jgi:hypothetical protein